VSSIPSGPTWASSFGSDFFLQELANLEAWFRAVDADHSGNITANELASMPVMGKPIGLPTAQTLIKVFDKNFSGQIDFGEYISLNQFLSKMQSAFAQNDVTRSGFLTYQQIHNAILGAGFQLGYSTIESLCIKFDPTRSGKISAETFVHVCAQLAAIRSIFEWNDPQRSGRVYLTLDQLSHIAIHLFEKAQ